MSAHTELARVVDARTQDEACPPALAGVRVLIVDDSEVTRELVARILEGQGAHVFPAASGDQALALLSRQEVDVVLMDVQMPEMDGHEVTRRIRDVAALGRLPIVAMTGGLRASDRQLALAAGMTDFVTKSLDPEQLTRVVRRHVEQGSGCAGAVRIRSQPEHRVRAEWQAIEGIDTPTAQRRFNGDERLFLSLLRRFLVELRELAELLTVTHSTEARQALAARVHKLVGTSFSLGALAVQEHGAALERLLRETAEPASLELHVAALQRAITELEEHARPTLEADLLRGVSGASAVDLARVEVLTELLRAQNLAALTELEQQAAALRQALGGARFRQLEQAVHELEFAAAVELLRGIAQLAS
jgi:CheY-like chemotaxis protein